MGKKKMGIVIIMFLLIIMLGTNDQIKSTMLSVFNDTRSLKVIDEYSINLKDYNNIEVFDNNILGYNHNIIGYYKLDGRKVWTRNIKKSKIYIFDKGIYIINDKIACLGLNNEYIWSVDNINTDRTINMGKYIMVVTDNKKGSNIRIINNNGKEILNKDIEQRDILTANISPKKDKIFIATLDTSLEEIDSKLFTYDMKGNILGEQTFKNQIIEIIKPLLDRTIVLSDEKLSVVRDNKLLWNKNITGYVNDIKIYNEKIYLLTYADNSLLNIMNLNGKTLKKVSVEKEYKNIENGEYVFLIGENHILAVDNGIEKIKYSLEEKILKTKIENNDIIIITNNDIKVTKVTNDK
ncbi:DUF5711 family protein [Dethiothermospora halolimnae]|uniref:DUF5711 family protein n=1 Tax=Dethiothermospora halolimnae TaxID=3114390 RepID=UPI003CCBA0E3